MISANRNCQRQGASRRFSPYLIHRQRQDPLAAGSLPLLTAIHPVLRLRYVNHDPLQLFIRVNQLNVAVFTPKFSRSSPELRGLLSPCSNSSNHENRPAIRNRTSM